RIDGGVVNGIVQHVLDAPAQRRLELLALHRGRLDEQNLVVRRLQQRGAAKVLRAEFARHTLEGLRVPGIPRALLGEFHRRPAAGRPHVSKAHRVLAELDCKPAWSGPPCEQAREEVSDHAIRYISPRRRTRLAAKRNGALVAAPRSLSSGVAS